MSDGALLQTDFSGGIWRTREGQRAPSNTAYDLENVLLDEDGAARKRGGSSNLSGLFPGTIMVTLSDLEYRVGRRTVTVDDAGQMWVLTDAGTFVEIHMGALSASHFRPVGVGQVAAFSDNAFDVPGVTYYAGSRKTAEYSTGTVTVTQGSAVVTGSGTSWLANADAGMLLRGTLLSTAVVQSVDSNTQLTLTAPYDGNTAAGAVYSLRVTMVGDLPGSPTIKEKSVVVVASVGSPQRLLVGYENRIHFSTLSTEGLVSLSGGALGALPVFRDTDYHELPMTAEVLGMEGVGWDCMVFTTDGLYLIANMAYELTDDLGNPQQRVDLVNRDLVLWGEQGISAWRGNVVAPCIDDVYVVSRGGDVEPVSGSIRPLYRAYVRAGHRPGIAAVHAGHYFLPILDTGSDWVDTLVCRLDGAQPAWTRWSGTAGESRAFAARAGSGTIPRLFGASQQSDRIVDLAPCFEPPPVADVDDVSAPGVGTVPLFRMELRDFAAAEQAAVTWVDLRLRYELEGAGQAAGIDLTARDPRPNGGADVAVGTLFGNPPAQGARVRFRKRAQALRLTLECLDATDYLVVRSVEARFRNRGLM